MCCVRDRVEKDKTHKIAFGARGNRWMGCNSRAHAECIGFRDTTVSSAKAFQLVSSLHLGEGD